MSSWGGLFLLAVGETDKAREAAATLSDFRVSGQSVSLSDDLDSFNETYSSGDTFSGYKPYAESPGYDDPPELVWAEGTWGALLLRMRLGDDVSSDLASMERLQAVDPDGGFIETTAGSRRLPYEFHVWPAVAGTAWAALVTGDPSTLWAPDGWLDQENSADVPLSDAGDAEPDVVSDARRRNNFNPCGVSSGSRFDVCKFYGPLDAYTMYWGTNSWGYLHILKSHRFTAATDDEIDYTMYFGTPEPDKDDDTTQNYISDPSKEDPAPGDGCTKFKVVYQSGDNPSNELGIVTAYCMRYRP